MPTKLELRVEDHDKQIVAIKKLIIAGMKMINYNNTQIKALQQAQRETARQVRETDRLVRETSQTLRDLLRSLGRRDGTNGHSKPPKGL